MEIKDLAGLSEPLTKLIEVVENGVGSLTEAWRIRKRADAKAYEIEKIAKAIHKASGLGATYKNEELELQVLDKPEPLQIAERALQRKAYQEAKAQVNIEQVTEYARQALENETHVSSEKVDEDWTTRFFKITQDISNEEMQILWGKILAGEVKQPGSFSLRTLETLKNLTKKEADAIIRLAHLTLRTDRKSFVYSPNDFSKITQVSHVQFSDIIMLSEIGILISKDNLGLSIDVTNVDESFVVIFTHDGYGILLEEKCKIKIPIIPLSQVGREIITLIDIETNYEYVKLLAEYLQNNNITAQWGKVSELIDNHVSLSDLKPILDKKV